MNLCMNKSVHEQIEKKKLNLCRGVRKAADLTKPVDKRVYKGTCPPCHDFGPPGCLKSEPPEVAPPPHLPPHHLPPHHL